MISLRSNVQFALTLVLASYPATTAAQTRVEEVNIPSRLIRCKIDTEHAAWKLNEPAVITGQIENLFDGPLEIKVMPILYLSSTTSDALRDEYWSPVDVLHDTALGTDRRAMDPKADVVSIESRPILLQFKKRGDSISFRFDAQHTLWARRISSVWPSRSLFSVVESGVYDLQLVLETDDGSSESQKSKIRIASVKPKRR
jgi:hypothetical protein